MMNGNGNESLLSLLDNAIKQLNKSGLVKKVLELKIKMVTNSEICTLYDDIKNLTQSLSKLLIKNDEPNSEIVVLKNVNRGLTKKNIKLKRSQAMSEQYTC